MSERGPSTLGAGFTTGIFARIGVDRYTLAQSPIGVVCVSWTVRGVTAVRRGDSLAAQAAFAAWYEQRTGRRVVRAREDDTIACAAQAGLSNADGADVPLDLASVTAFERAVLSNIGRIKRGYARPSTLLAADIDQAPEGQSVDAILAGNPLPLIVPCHRVIREDRCGGNYVFGAPVQQQLLQAEGLDPAAIDAVFRRGIRYIGNDGWFCLPCCGDIAKRVDQPGYVGLRSLAEAHACGLHACESCRPLAA